MKDKNSLTRLKACEIHGTAPAHLSDEDIAAGVDHVDGVIDQECTDEYDQQYRVPSSAPEIEKMRIANPPIFRELHASTIVALAAELEPPCVIACYDDSTNMLVIASVIPGSICHWTVSGPVHRDHIEQIAEQFRLKQGLSPDRLHNFDFDSTKVIQLIPNDKKPN
ncbi:MAG: hypothetical protein K0U72_09745 [Gammaproteobacteria bacterium]|nr:hypothetical protein [Gammaproteobacteria bacterium]